MGNGEETGRPKGWKPDGNGTEIRQSWIETVMKGDENLTKTGQNQSGQKSKETREYMNRAGGEGKRKF